MFMGMLWEIKFWRCWEIFLKKQFREQDVIGRIGGDEFVILLYNIGSRQNMENKGKKSSGKNS